MVVTSRSRFPSRGRSFSGFLLVLYPEAEKGHARGATSAAGVHTEWKISNGSRERIPWERQEK